MLILDLSADLIHQDSMVDRRKKLPNIALPNIGVSFGIFLALPNRSMGPLALTAGKGVGDKALLEYELQSTGQCVMDDPIPVRRRSYFSLLGLVNKKGSIARRLINLGPQLFVQGNEFSF